MRERDKSMMYPVTLAVARRLFRIPLSAVAREIGVCVPSVCLYEEGRITPPSLKAVEAGYCRAVAAHLLARASEIDSGNEVEEP